MPDFGIFRGFNEKLFGDKLYAGQLPTQLGLIGSDNIIPLLLDTYTGAAAAYSLRKLRSAYTGSAIEVRIDTSGQPTYDIGFVNGELDTATLEDYCTGGLDAYVTTWYDQSGNGYDATQSTDANQPQIVSSGSVITENGNPAIQFDSSDDFLGTNDFTEISQPITHFGIYKSSANGFVTSSNTSAIYRHILWAGTSSEGFAFAAGSKLTTSNTLTGNPNQVLHYALANEVNSQTGIQDYPLSSGDAGSFTLRSIKIGRDYDGSNPVDGTVSEYIMYPSDQSSNRSGIKTNINNFYSIY